MTEPNYVTRLREIRDRIGQDVEHMSWDAWKKRTCEEVSQHPGLARMQARAVKPSQLSRRASNKS